MKYTNVLTPADIAILLDYFNVIDNRSDVRPDVTSKHPRWGVDKWPQGIVKKVLDQVIEYDYSIEEVIFNESKISFRLHVDSGNCDSAKKGDIILIPLYAEGPAHTILFDNYWTGTSTKFSKEKILPFEYQLLNCNNKWQYIPDIRELHLQASKSPETVTDFYVDNQFIQDLEYLISARSNNQIAKVDNRCYDYTNVINYDPSLVFDQEIHKNYLNHISLETLNGLKVQEIFDWNIGSCLTFNRTQLHAASSCHNRKIGISIFTLHH